MSFETCGLEPALPVPADSLISGPIRGLHYGMKAGPLAAVLHKT
jgi:hypothetical protein